MRPGRISPRTSPRNGGARAGSAGAACSAGSRRPSGEPVPRPDDCTGQRRTNAMTSSQDDHLLAVDSPASLADAPGAATTRRLAVVINRDGGTVLRLGPDRLGE